MWAAPSRRPDSGPERRRIQRQLQPTHLRAQQRRAAAAREAQRAWPMFSHRLSAAGLRPISGLPLGVAGRSPAGYGLAGPGRGTSWTWRLSSAMRSGSICASPPPMSTIAAMRSTPAGVHDAAFVVGDADGGRHAVVVGQRHGQAVALERIERHVVAQRRERARVPMPVANTASAPMSPSRLCTTTTRRPSRYKPETGLDIAHCTLAMPCRRSNNASVNWRQSPAFAGRVDRARRLAPCRPGPVPAPGSGRAPAGRRHAPGDQRARARPTRRCGRR